ncbi:hypothetical protein GCM10022246_24880 [Pedobacter ginsengiterrae]|uniref:Uncharacterized protein n=1 Tax=Pedobacter ginsengiterrae TaxID=871696 RepID=A0ABP7PUG2_9SPHI
MKDKSLRFTDNPLAEEMPYAFNTKDFMAEDWQVVSKVDHVKLVENLNKA